MPAQFSIVFSSVPDEETGHQIAKALVSEGLAACVHVGSPGSSIYKWEGKLEHVKECPMIIKSHPSLSLHLVQRLSALHPYDTPEILIVDGEKGSEAYIAWLKGSISTQIT